MTLNFQFLCFGLVGAGIVLSIVLNVIFGGFKIGNVTRQKEIVLPPDQLQAFLSRMYQRLEELGFKSEGPGAFVQRGAEFGVPTSHTHAKSPKRLEVTADQSDPQQVKIGMTVRYLELIVGDTGESAYADAVMSYIGNESGSMQLVANRSFMAFSSLVLSAWAWVVMLVMKVLHIEPFTPTILTLSVTPILTSLLAIVTIALKPKELRGMMLAIVGLVMGLLALGVCVLLLVFKAAA